MVSHIYLNGLIEKNRSGLMPKKEYLKVTIHGKEIPNELAESLYFELNVSIVQELIQEERDKNFTEEQSIELFKKCKDNPWNAVIMYDLLKGKHND